ncbi:MAG: (deoxy)nucleoside triphosphate pyrophosphohydrolase [Desulfobacterales bacterium]|nr:(deoxy)nucleoside triphosphate pyrophosphohydrolase [Desulfobacterales bacterium]
MNKPHFHVTAGLLWREGRLLIAKRPQGSHLAGFWEFPGGKQEARETLKECLEREIREELGMEVQADEPLMNIDHEYEAKSISLHVFHCSRVRGEPKPLGCDEIRWVLPEDLVLYPLPPPDLKLIPFIKKWSEDKYGGSGS